MLHHRDVELAKFEAFLKAEDAREISALVRGSQHLAYPIKGWATLPCSCRSSGCTPETMLGLRFEA